MREAFSSLTTRGRGLLAGGLTAVVCGLAIGMPAMVRVGAFAALLPLVVVLIMSRARYRLTLTREVIPARVACGESATVRLQILNEGFRPPGSVLVEDEIGYALGARPRLRLDALAKGRVHSHDYRVASDVRGHHVLGPARLTVSDSLGLVEVLRQFRSTSTLVVLPAVVPLTRSSGRPSAHTGTRGRAASPLSASDDATVRAYRRGDDVRRVHWRSSARLGELMVRQEDLPHRPTSVVLLDVRHRAHCGSGAASSFEVAVRAATSVLVHLHAEGHDLLLVAGAQRLEVTSQDADALAAALSFLAQVRLEATTTLPLPGTDAAGSRREVMALLGHVNAADSVALAAWASETSRARAIVLDVEEWGATSRGPASQESTGVLTTGWAAARLGPRDDLDTAWRGVA